MDDPARDRYLTDPELLVVGRLRGNATAPTGGTAKLIGGRPDPNRAGGTGVDSRLVTLPSRPMSAPPYWSGRELEQMRGSWGARSWSAVPVVGKESGCRLAC